MFCLILAVALFGPGCRRAAETTVVNVVKVDLGAHFDRDGIAFDYPRDWAEFDKASFDKLRDHYGTRRGGDLLAMLFNADETCRMQVTNEQTLSSLEKMYEIKKVLVKQIKKQMRSRDSHLKKYRLELVTFKDGRQAIMEYTEQERETAANYQFIANGVSHDVNFSYASPKLAKENENARMQILESLKIAL
jgi:hypothetical protein